MGGEKKPPVELYTPERKAEFLLNNAIDLADFRRARADVRALGVDPDSIVNVAPRQHV